MSLAHVPALMTVARSMLKAFAVDRAHRRSQHDLDAQARFLDNAFKDGGFSRLRAILDFLEESGTALDIYEYGLEREGNAATPGVHRSKTTAEIVRNEMTASEGDRERMDVIWELRLAEEAKGTADRQ